MIPGAGPVGGELTVAGAGGDALFHRPEDCAVEIIGFHNIGEGVLRRLRFRGTHGPPQEGDNLGTGTGLVGREGGGRGAGGDTVFHCPEDGFEIPLGRLHVRKGIARFRFSADHTETIQVQVGPHFRVGPFTGEAPGTDVYGAAVPGAGDRDQLHPFSEIVTQRLGDGIQHPGAAGAAVNGVAAQKAGGFRDLGIRVVDMRFLGQNRDHGFVAPAAPVEQLALLGAGGLEGDFALIPVVAQPGDQIRDRFFAADGADTQGEALLRTGGPMGLGDIAVARGRDGFRIAVTAVADIINLAKQVAEGAVGIDFIVMDMTDWRQNLRPFLSAEGAGIGDLAGRILCCRDQYPALIRLVGQGRGDGILPEGAAVAALVLGAAEFRTGGLHHGGLPGVFPDAAVPVFVVIAAAAFPGFPVGVTAHGRLPEIPVPQIMAQGRISPVNDFLVAPAAG